MAEVLSQSQIDALLNSLGGDSDETSEPTPIEEQGKDKNYRKYDFYSPKKFTKERLKIITSVYDNYARIATSQINSLFRVSSEVEILTVEEQRYYEFGNALNESDILTLVDVKLPDNSKNPPLLIHASTPVMVNLIDRMLGSTGEAVPVDETYNYTEIELVLYERIIRYFIAILKDAWANYVKLDFQFSRLEKNPSMFQDIGVDETIVIIVLEVKMKGASGRISICAPGNLLLSIFTIMDRRKHISLDEDGDNRGNREEIMDNVKNSVLDVSAKLGEVQLDLEEVSQFRVGDVINLNKPQDATVQVAIEGQPWFTGQLGVHNRKMAIKIDERLIDVMGDGHKNQEQQEKQGISNIQEETELEPEELVTTEVS
ncbi:MAG: FliM/FliN family flagellar motor switch protein [Lachnospiraceae bacterium]